VRSERKEKKRKEKNVEVKCDWHGENEKLHWNGSKARSPSQL
jgi:hypothetical protein